MPNLTKRRKRTERQVLTKPICLTERDESVLKAIYEYRVLSQVQISRFIFQGKATVAQRRLRLYDGKYLDRRFQLKEAGILASPILYLLDKTGNDYLIKYHAFSEKRWTAKRKKVGYGHLEHLLEVNDFRMTFTLGCQYKGFTLENWIDDMSFHKSYDTVAVEGYETPVAVQPDGYAVLRTSQHKQLHFFVELDRGTETVGEKFKKKMAAYHTYFKSSHILKRFSTKEIRVLIVAHSEKRAHNLKKITEKIGGKSRYWFATLPELTPENIFNEPVWNKAGHSEKTTLIY